MNVSHTPRQPLAIAMLLTMMATLLSLASPASAAVPDPALAEAQVAHERAETPAGEHTAQTEPAKARYARAGAGIGAALTGIPTLVGVVWALGSTFSEMYRRSGSGEDTVYNYTTVAVILLAIGGYAVTCTSAAVGAGFGAAAGYGVGAAVDAFEE